MSRSHVCYWTMRYAEKACKRLGLPIGSDFGVTHAVDHGSGPGDIYDNLGKLSAGVSTSVMMIPPAPPAVTPEVTKFVAYLYSYVEGRMVNFMTVHDLGHIHNMGPSESVWMIPGTADPNE